MALPLLSCVNSDADNDQHEHYYSDTYSYDENEHWFAAICGHDVKRGEGEHTFKDWEIIIQPSILAKGKMKRVCSVCGYFETKDIDQIASYIITWKNYDGSILETDIVESNKIPLYKGLVPVKDTDNTYRYVFKGWDKEVVNCFEDTTYTAVYEATYIDLSLIHI